MTHRIVLAATAVLAVSIGFGGTAHAQTTAPGAVDSSPAANGNLSEKLEKSDGVITPSRNVDPGITTAAPVPNPGTTPVIPPPGSPGGNQSVQPK